LKKLFRNIKGVLALSLCTVNTVGCFIPLIFFALIKLLLPVKAARLLLTRWIMSIGEFWIAMNAHVFAAFNNTRWDIRGVDTLSPDKWYLLIANHQTWVDVVVLQTALNHKIPFLKFFIKQQLIWFPLLGMAWWAMDMPFMKRYSKSYLAKHPDKKGSDLEATRKACEKFKNTPTTVINFIEGTRFSAEKKAKRGSEYQNLLPPRAGGIALALASMGDMLDVMLDVTIVYPDGSPPRFWELMCGEFNSVIVDVRQRDIEDWMVQGNYSNDRDHRKVFHQWLTEIWWEKDKQIDQLKSA